MIEKLVAHTRYLQLRPRAVFEKDVDRNFFNGKDKNIDRHEVVAQIQKLLGEKVAYHKIILSPGDNSISLTDHACEVMELWQKSMGREFEWWAVNHYNTDHYHTHVIVAGRDNNGREIFLNREKLAELREISRRYLARERNLDLDLDRDADIHTDLMFVRHELIERLADMNISRFNDWQMQVDAGLRTDQDYQREWKDLGLGRIYELGRPFENLKKVSRDDQERESSGSSSSETKDGGAPGSPDGGGLQPGGWLQQQVVGSDQTISDGMTDAKNHDDRDDDETRITAKGRI